MLNRCLPINILIIGNCGSGKSFMGRHLAAALALEYWDLDSIVWQGENTRQKNSAAHIDAQLTPLAKKQGWIVEGIYGRLMQRLLTYADRLIWLNLPLSVCVKNLHQRAQMQAAQITSSQQHRLAADVMHWAQSYQQRSGESSASFHRELFASARCEKIEIKASADVDAYLQLQTSGKNL